MEEGERVWNAVRGFITFFSFVRLCMKFNTFFAFIKLSFLKIILTSHNISIIRKSQVGLKFSKESNKVPNSVPYKEWSIGQFQKKKPGVVVWNLSGEAH